MDRIAFKIRFLLHYTRENLWSDTRVAAILRRAKKMRRFHPSAEEPSSEQNPTPQGPETMYNSDGVATRKDASPARGVNGKLLDHVSGEDPDPENVPELQARYTPIPPRRFQGAFPKFEC